MSENYKMIYDLISQKDIDWSAVENAVKSLGDRINEKYEEGTILSDSFESILPPFYNSNYILTYIYG